MKTITLFINKTKETWTNLFLNEQTCHWRNSSKQQTVDILLSCHGNNSNEFLIILQWWLFALRKKIFYSNVCPR